MRSVRLEKREELEKLLPGLSAGDCLEVESLDVLASDSRELLAVAAKLSERGAELTSLREDLDTRREADAGFFRICAALAALDRQSQREKQRAGIERAREAGRYRGRKPIAIDDELFEGVVQRWQNGQITARQAMEKLNLKPNTFYRRIKEREVQKMKDYKEMGKDIRTEIHEIKEAAKQGHEDLKELRKQVHAEVKEVSGKIELHDAERELRRERRRVEAAYDEGVKEMKKEVEAETRELKKLISDAE